MTEAKRVYMLEALDELEDIFIAEAAEYQKSGLVWRYTRELFAAAACLLVLFISANAVRMIPIGGTKSDASAEMVQENAAEITTNRTEGILEEAGNAEYKAEYKTEESLETEIFLENSIGITVEELAEDSNAAAENGSGSREETDGEYDSPNVESAVTSSSELVWLEPKELFALDIDIFMGKVVEMQSYKVSGGMNEYFTVAAVEVQDGIRGEIESGSVYRIYMPYAKVDGKTMSTSSAGGALDQLEVGSRAIFMPYKATEESGKEGLEARLSYGDFAEYYFEEGMRFLFLEKDGELLFEENVYQIPKGKKASLEDAAVYIRETLENMSAEQ